MMADTVYTPTGQASLVRQESDNETRLIAAALAANFLPGFELQQMVRPTVAVPLFRPLFGFRNDEPRLEDVFGSDLRFGNPRVDFSQRRSGYSGTSYPSLNQW